MLVLMSASLAGRRTIVALAVLAALLGALHHADHIVRANHVGWPLTDDVTPFTFSLLVYPLLLGGAWFTARRGLTPWYWVVVSLATAALVTWVHFSPDPRGEQVADLFLPYADPSAYCGQRSVADPPVADCALCSGSWPASPALGAAAVGLMLALATVLWSLAAVSIGMLLTVARRRESGAP